MPTPVIHRDTICGEALFILQSLRENGRLGRSNKLADVKASLEPSVSLEFDSYYLFLRKYHYIALDPREAQLRLSDMGERVVDTGMQDQFIAEVGEFFAEQLGLESLTTEDTVAQAQALKPPPPPEEESELASSEARPSAEPPALPRARPAQVSTASASPAG